MMAGNTPIHGFPYPDGSDPINEGDDKIHELALAVESKIIDRSSATPLAGTYGDLWVMEAGTTVFTTNGASAGVLSFVTSNVVGLQTVIVNPGDDPTENQCTSFDYHTDYCQVIYFRGGVGVPGGAVRINYIAILNRTLPA